MMEVEEVKAIAKILGLKSSQYFVSTSIESVKGRITRVEIRFISTDEEVDE